MPRPLWPGSLSFGLVNVRVGLYSATEDHSPHFNQFERGTSDRIRYRRVNERTGDEVDYDNIVRGAAVGGDEYVIVENEELEAIAPGRSRSLEISDFVPAEDIDPLLYQKTYYLAPGAEDSETAYALLREALKRTERVGVATFVMRSREYLAVVRPYGAVLALSTVHFADEVRDPEKAVKGEPPVLKKSAKKQLDVAEQLIESMSGPWEPEQYHDTYRERVDELIEAKQQGRETVEENEPPEDTNVVDLMDALRASVREQGGKQSGGTDRRRQGRRGRGKKTSSGSTREGSGRSMRATSGGTRGSSKSSGRSTSTGSGRSGSTRTSGSRRRPDDLAEASKADLMTLARELEVSGRSSMDRRDLESAVRKASGGRRRSKRAS
ncbi:MAG: Ku protein [Actinocatenispora sp.]